MEVGLDSMSMMVGTRTDCDKENTHHAHITHTRIHNHTYAHIHTYTYTHITNTYTHIRTHIRTHIHTYIHTYTHTYTRKNHYLVCPARRSAPKTTVQTIKKTESHSESGDDGAYATSNSDSSSNRDNTIQWIPIIAKTVVFVSMMSLSVIVVALNNLGNPRVV